MDGVGDGTPFQLGEKHLPQHQYEGIHLIWLKSGGASASFQLAGCKLVTCQGRLPGSQVREGNNDPKSSHHLSGVGCPFKLSQGSFSQSWHGLL